MFHGIHAKHFCSKAFQCPGVDLVCFTKQTKMNQTGKRGTQVSCEFDVCLQKDARQCCSITRLDCTLSTNQNKEYSTRTVHGLASFRGKQTLVSHVTQTSFYIQMLIKRLLQIFSKPQKCGLVLEFHDHVINLHFFLARVLRVLMYAWLYFV